MMLIIDGWSAIHPILSGSIDAILMWSLLLLLCAFRFIFLMSSLLCIELRNTQTCRLFLMNMQAMTPLSLHGLRPMRQAMRTLETPSIRTFPLRWCGIEEIIGGLLERRDLP